jgi:hypothetical protein
MTGKAFRQKTDQARDVFWRQLGELSPNLLTPLIDPMLMGGPAWPDHRQAWRVIRKGSHTLLISDGLSDPVWDEPAPNIGFGLEVLVETGESLPERLQDSWLFQLVYQVSQYFADLVDERKKLAQSGMLAISVSVMEGYSIGVLLGIESPQIPRECRLPGGSVRIVTARYLWPSERIPVCGRSW